MARNSHSNGFSLIELLVATSVGAVLMLMGAALILRQSESIIKLKQNSELSDLKVELQMGLVRPETCIENFQAPFAINQSQIATAGYKVQINQPLRSRVGDAPVFEIGQPPKGIPAYRVSNIQAVRIARLGDNTFKFDVEVEIKNRNDEIVKVLQFPRIRLRSNPASGSSAKTASSCNSEERAPARSCRTNFVIGTNGTPQAVFCDPTEEVLTGGTKCLPATGELLWNPSIPDTDFGWVSYSQPVLTSGSMGWAGDCANTATINTVRAKVYVVCCL